MKIAFVGFGEAGSAIVSGWGDAKPGHISAYDIKSDDPGTAPEITARCAQLGIDTAPSLEAALEGADIVFCTVTADQAVSAAKAAAPLLGQGTIWCDLNSCAPSSKRTSAGVIEAGGGRYVDVAVMAPVHPKLNMVPLLVGGPHAVEVTEILRAMPMAPRVFDGPVGAASSVKMIRSVMVKGLEALTAECVLAAVAAGIENEVLESLNKSHPGTDWDAQAAYNFERVLVHGVRRAAEMEEVAKTLSDLDLPNDMTKAAVLWQRRVAGTGVAAPEDLRSVDATTIAQSILPALRRS